MDKWWTWRWDRVEGAGTIKYDWITRWRRGWVTLYRHELDGVVEWRLYLPFNISIGIQLGGDK